MPLLHCGTTILLSPTTTTIIGLVETSYISGKMGRKKNDQDTVLYGITEVRKGE